MAETLAPGGWNDQAVFAIFLILILLILSDH